MKTRILILIALLLSNCSALADTPPQVQSFIQSWHKAIDTQDIDSVLNLIHPDVPEEAITASKGMLIQHLQKYADVTPHITIQSCKPIKDVYLIEALFTTNAMNTGKSYLFKLKQVDTELKLVSFFEQAEPPEYDPDTRLVSSIKGQFTLKVPLDWYAVKPIGAIAAISADSAIILGPDMESTVAMGVVQLPMKLADSDEETAKIAVQSDAAVEKRMTENHKIISQGPITLGDRIAYMMQTQFNMKGSPTVYNRSRYYIHHEPMIYFFLCDNFDPNSELVAQHDFDTILNSFKVLPQEQGINLQEAMVAEQGEGEITGSVYTSDSFNCFIAAPEGWTLRTSANKAHLAEMQYNDGKSIARLIAQKNIPDNLSLKDLVEAREKSLEQVTLSYESLSTRTQMYKDHEAIEQILIYTLENVGHFQEKTINLMHGNTYYMILCQCIEPDEYTTLEADFDQIIASFGFIQ